MSESLKPESKLRLPARIAVGSVVVAAAAFGALQYGKHVAYEAGTEFVHGVDDGLENSTIAEKQFEEFKQYFTETEWREIILSEWEEMGITFEELLGIIAKDTELSVEEVVEIIVKEESAE